MEIAITVAVFLILGYLLGSINGAVLLSKTVYGDDIRNHGSHNAGTTNMLRTYGKAAAAFTLLIDAFKGAVAAFIPVIIFSIMGNDELRLYGMLAAAFGAVLGHNWPVYFKFKGGKGVLTTFIVMLCIAPVPALIVLGVFIILVALTKFVSLGSITAAACFPLIVYFMGGWLPDTKGICVFFFVALFLCAMMIVRHHANIVRLLKGTESKLSFSKKEKQ